MENGDGKKKTIEGTYQKKTQLEHILLRPDTYIGSIEQVTESMWVFDKDEERMIQREITYVPGLYKIFDEILVNAADNKQRDQKMDKIKIDIKQDDNTISVWNNGKGIPVAIHKDENMYVPTMIFGHLLTSSNYDDAENKVTGGRNGYGAKLCNIFSGRFVVETASKEYKKSFKQSWLNNMNKCSEARIKEHHGEDFTKVTFSPDLEKFKMEKLDDDIVSLMTRRAYDCAASTKGVKIYLNGTLIPVKSFKDYCELFIKGRTDDSNNQLKLSYEQCGPRWEVAVALSPDNSFKQMSFVNSIATTKGGKHVDHVSDAIVKKLQETLKKKNKEGAKLDKKAIKQHMWIFINCLITNPTFDSQTKENMTLIVSKFGSKYDVSDKFILSISKLGIIESILHWAKFKADTQLQKLTGTSKKKKISGIPKLNDANHAGTSKSIDCTLILTEGDSAKSTAVSGIGSINNGQDYYGVFPLKGKLLNVREATHKQIIENAEINNLIKILGLQYKKKYETNNDLKTLRYGKLMIMTDQDQDGSHIKGLLINFIHHNWPSLLKLNFIEEFITPLLKVTKGNKTESFFSTAEYEEWCKNEPTYKKWKTKYYKGLGTSTSKEAKEYFSDMQKHRISFKYSGDDDDKNIIMAFSKKCCDQRKDWLTNYMTTNKDRKERGLGEKFLYHKNTRAITFSDFINVELVSFSNYDNIRSIPNVIDGLKPGQRKVMYVSIIKNNKDEIKVAQLGAAVAEKSDYHHGETSLASTIVNLAQDYVGSNNINLLLPIGQFGTRLCGGKDAASARYIFTKLSPLTRLIFHKDDDPLLQHEYSDDKKIEPTYFIPIIPMVLVNGADGIGTGWMTKIPNHNPREIIQNLYNMMDGNDIKPMKPYWKNFKGVIDGCGDTRFSIHGEITIISDDKIQISELPVGVWTNNYKESVLDVMLNKNEAIIDYKEHSTDTEVNFIVTMSPQKLRDYEREGLHKVFKLSTTISLSSMCAFDKNLCLQKYDDVNRIMREFYDLRLEYYDKRKKYLTGILEAEARKLTNQARFILEKCDNTLIIENKKKKAMIDELVSMGYDSDPVAAWKSTQNLQQDLINNDDDEEIQEDDNQTQDDVVDFDYLLGMAMWSLTKEKKDELLKKRDDKKTELELLKNKTPIGLWRDDLDALLIALNEFEEKQIKEEKSDTKKSKQQKGKKNNKEFKYEDGRRVIPEFDAETKKKYEKLDLASKEKKEGIIKKPRVKKEIGIKEEKDEFDVMIESNAKSLDDRLGLSPIEKKTIKKIGAGGSGRQTTLPFKPIDKKTKQKRKSKGSDDSSDDSDPDIDFESISPPPVSREGTRRAAANKKTTYNLDLDDDDNNNSDSDELEFKTNDDSIDKIKDNKPLISSPVMEQSDSDNDFQNDKKLKIPKQSSEELFDSLVGVTPEKTNNKLSSVVLSSCDDSSSPIKPSLSKKSKATNNKKKNENGSGTSKTTNKRQLNKKRQSSGSDSDEMFTIKSRKRVKKSESNDDDDDDDDFVDDSPVVPKKTTSARSRKQISYQLDSDSDSD